jgi:hypothetical protein
MFLDCPHLVYQSNNIGIQEMGKSERVSKMQICKVNTFGEILQRAPHLGHKEIVKTPFVTKMIMPFLLHCITDKQVFIICLSCVGLMLMNIDTKQSWH